MALQKEPELLLVLGPETGKTLNVRAVEVPDEGRVPMGGPASSAEPDVIGIRR